MSIGDFIKNEVYPALDAVDAGLLDHLNPKASNRTFIVECPQCGEHEGFYYPYSGYINCPRKNECGIATSIWDVLAKQNYSNREIVETLCGAAGATPPDSNVKQIQTPSQLIIHITRRAAKSKAGKDRVAAFCKARNLSEDDFKFLGLGYYPSNAYMIKALQNNDADINECERLGFIVQDKQGKTILDDRIVGYWEQEDGSARLWGRAIGSVSKAYPKYCFYSHSDKPMSKTKPYRFKKNNRVTIMVEGTLDADTLRLLGNNAIAAGQAGLNQAQAAYLASQGCERLLHITDSDRAGISGGLATIKNALPLGIAVSISHLGQGMDDIDALRMNGKEETIKQVLRKSVPAPEFMANIVAGSYYDSSLVEFRTKIESIMPLCDSATHCRYEKRMAELGIIKNDEADALLLASNLINAGVSNQEVIRIINTKYGINLSLNDMNAQDENMIRKAYNQEQGLIHE